MMMGLFRIGEKREKGVGKNEKEEKGVGDK